MSNSAVTPTAFFYTPLTNWVAFTPTGGMTTNTTYSGYYRRVGSNLEMRVKMAFSGAPNAVAATINLPGGLTIDPSILLDTTVASASLGEVTFVDSAGNPFIGKAMYHTSTSIRIFDIAANQTFAFVDPMAATAPFTFGSGDVVLVEVNCAVTEWIF
jgi:hypothetical protein